MVFDRRTLLAASLAGVAASTASTARAQVRPTPSRTADAMAATKPFGDLEFVAPVRSKSTPAGFTMSASGRMFATFPRYTEDATFAVAEIDADGLLKPYPDEAVNRADPRRAAGTFLWIQNGVVDERDRLWLLDAGLMTSKGPPLPDGAKLVCIDLATDRIVRTLPLAAAVTPTSSLNDLRVDLRRGTDGTAFITDQGTEGKGAIVVVDLGSGRTLRRLARHSSTEAVEGAVKFTEGRVLMEYPKEGGPPRPQKGGANGIALSADRQTLYYAPLTGRQLYGVSAGALADPAADDAAIGATVRELGEKGMTGGLTTDDRDNVYFTWQEIDALGRRTPEGRLETLALDPRLIWPDTLWITPDRWLYVIAAQYNRAPQFDPAHRDRREPPYGVYRVRIDAGPVA